MARFVLWASALPFAAIGLGFLLWPGWLGPRVGLTVTSATADNDLRAVYGGLQLGCAVFLALCAARPGWHRPGLAAQLALFAGMFLARGLSWLVVGWPEAIGFALHAAEALGLGFGVLAWRSLPQAEKAAASGGSLGS